MKEITKGLGVLGLKSLGALKVDRAEQVMPSGSFDGVGAGNGMPVPNGAWLERSAGVPSASERRHAVAGDQ